MSNISWLEGHGGTTSAEIANPMLSLSLVEWRGQEMALRPATTGDDRALSLFLKGLSRQTLYQRYFSLFPISSADQVQAEVARLLETTRYTLVGWLPDTNTIAVVVEIAGLPTNPQSAEIALTVADEYQRQGLGTAVCAILPTVLVARGISRLQACAFAENRAVARLFAAFGRYQAVHRDGLIEFQAVLG